MLQTTYNNLTYAKIENLHEFFSEKLPEITKLRSMISVLKVMFTVTNDRISIEVAQEDRVYKIIILDSTTQKSPIGYFIYIPLQGRVDIYDAMNLEVPLIQWKDKKVKFKNYSRFLDKVGLDKLFLKVVQNS